MLHVVMLARGYRPEKPNFVLDELRRGLAAAGGRLTVDGAWSESYASADLIIAFEPIEDRKSLSGARILGQRTLNRFQRMQIAASTDALVAEFGSPRNNDELSALTRGWGPFCVLKYDWSLRRNGVFTWPLGDDRPAFPSDFTPDCDLFMKFVDGDPVTYKVDAFCGTVLAGWILPTRDMRELDWQVIDTPGVPEFDITPQARASVEAVSEALIAQGVGYASYDLMRDARGFHLIEANTCGVSTAMWDLWPERYATNYTRAILRVLDRIDRVPVWGSLREGAYRAGHVQATVPLRAKAAGVVETVAPPAVDASPKPAEPASAEMRFFTSFTKTERLPPDSLTRYVRSSLQTLLHHAHRHSPFHQERLGFLFDWDGSILWERWHDVPLLRFEDIARRRHIMQCRVVPLAHGSSTPVRVERADGTRATLSKSLIQTAAELCTEARLYQWHKVDFSEEMATLWPDAPPRVETPWAPGFLPPPLGRDHRGDTSTLPEAMLRWLKDLGPIHLRAQSSVARTLAMAAAGNPALRPSLKKLFTRGEAIDDETRRLCREHLGSEPIDAYHRAEGGLMALQCSVLGAYHVQNEVCLVEVVDQHGRVCEPGETGEVAITILHNFAMPLIRYATGDLGRIPAGPDGQPRACSCGRTLPLIERVTATKRVNESLTQREPHGHEAFSR